MKATRNKSKKIEKQVCQICGMVRHNGIIVEAATSLYQWRLKGYKVVTCKFCLERAKS